MTVAKLQALLSDFDPTRLGPSPLSSSSTVPCFPTDPMQTGAGWYIVSTRDKETE